MSNKPIIPIFSGERIHGDTIEGDLIYDHEIMQHYIIHYETNTHNAIKTETLRISLDGGTTFRTLGEVVDALYLTDNINKGSDDGVIQYYFIGGENDK